MRLMLLLLLGLSCCFADLRAEGQSLHPQEVETWRQMAIKLKMDEKLWDFNANNWTMLGAAGLANESAMPVANVACNCSFNDNTVCHIVIIQLSRMNLTGVLPAEIANFTHLEHLDLSRNYLNGSIPSEWASLPLFNLSFHGNRVSGGIPKEFGNMTVIKSLQFENNLLEGPLPAELGNLKSLNRLFLSGNNISGGLPDSFVKLTNLTDFRIDGTSVSGSFPSSIIAYWQRVNRIDMVGTSLSGPIPNEISSLRNLTELRVSDLEGSEMRFPALQNAVELRELVLRNCSIYGGIPTYLGSMIHLRVLDLSFNKLTGRIPNNFGSMILDYMYLSDNALTGDIPEWMLRNLPSSKKNLDISYNNFTGTTPPSCQAGNVNMVATFPSSDDKPIDACFRKNFPCSSTEKYKSLFINCGGDKVDIEGTLYDEDLSQIGTSMFQYAQSRRWAYSSTGDFVGNEDANYIAKNISSLNMTYSALYTEARLSPISLKYYGLCLENGNYSVNLHFAEIIYTDDKTFYSHGKRFFDVYIQGKRVLRYFNIKAEAGGYGRAVIMNFTALVEDNTLEIHFYWAGKGTNAIPSRGYYGPLISAISVRKISDDKSRNKLSVGAISGIVASSSVLFIIILAMLWLRYASRGPEKVTRKHREHYRLPNHYFTLKEIEFATGNFDPANKIGEGGFGSVFKGVLKDGTQVAVKQLSPMSRQGNREFLTEFGMVSALKHPNLVILFGCCTERDQLLLVYEYMENNSLGRALFGEEQHRLKLNWTQRFSICLGIARGLAHLHESSLRVVHRDIKPTNILLDKDFNPKISDFGLAKLYETEKTHISTRIAGTVGYMAPEYATRGHLTDKADVFSFGVVILELISGKRNTDCLQGNEMLYLIDCALFLQKQGRLLELVDPNLESKFIEEEALRTLHVSLLCTNASPIRRPSMAVVVNMLNGEVPIPVSAIGLSATEAWTLEVPERHPPPDISTTWLTQQSADSLDHHYDDDEIASHSSSNYSPLNDDMLAVTLTKHQGLNQ